jgi:acetyltransferase-like isoleucine patch superfamily enzyme
MLRTAFKGVAIAIGFVLAAPGAAAAQLTGSVNMFRTWGEIYSLLPGLVGRYVRAAYYHMTLARCPMNLNIGIFSKFNHRQSEVGDRVMIGSYCSIGLVTFADHSACAERSSILSRTPQHNFTDPSRLVLAESNAPSRVTVGYDTHIGAGCIVLADIGAKCIIGPGSVVVSDIEEYSIAVGNPARVVRRRERPAGTAAAANAS